jgi:hypothetical protein
MMDLIVERVDVWVASIKDKIGGLSHLLSGLRKVGADLDFVLARRAPDKPGEGVVFLTPLRGDTEIAAAAMLGFNLTTSIDTLRIEGENVPGVAEKLTAALAAAGINLHGFSGAVIGTSFIIYISFENAQDVVKAEAILKQL